LGKFIPQKAAMRFESNPHFQIQLTRAECSCE
jgi:hypothetical protein